MSYSSRRPPDISGMHSLKVDNLSWKVTVHDVKDFFIRYGDIGDIYIPRDPKTLRSRGFAFVRFYEKRDAEDAIDRCDGREFFGRRICVDFARFERPQQRTRRRRSRSDSRDRRRRSRSRSRSRSYSASPRRSPRRSRSRSRSARRSSRSRSRSRTRSQ